MPKLQQTKGNARHWRVIFNGGLYLGVLSTSYERRGWVTYTHETDIKEVSGLIGAAKIKDTLLSCSVNRELTRRVKHAPPATWTRKAVHTDLHQVIKLVKFWDEKNRLWEHAPDGTVEVQVLVPKSPHPSKT